MRPGLALLRQLAPFQSLPDEALDSLNQIATVMVADQSQKLITQGMRPDRLFALFEGQVALSSTAPDGTTAVVEVVHPPGLFVLGTLLLDLPYVQSAHAVSRSRLIAFDAARLRHVMEQTPALMLALLTVLSRDYRNLVRQIRDLKVRTAAQRLGAYLLALVPDPTATQAEIRLPFEKGLLAARLGCRQENLSRAFAALRELDVETRGARVTLRDIPRLTAYSMPDYLNDPELAKPVPVQKAS